MGTSSSSKGSPSNVPMVPPWAPDPLPPDTGGDGGDNGENDAEPTNAIPPSQSTPVPVAPAGRFGPARTSLGSFARTGSGEDMRRGVGHYAGKGLGGSRTGARRLSGTARTAGTLFGALSAMAAGQAPTVGSPLDPALLAGRSADEVMDAIVEAVRPVDGTQDGEASREAISKALSELLDQYPDADLLDLSEEQRLYAVERYIACDVFNRFRLDVGKTIQEKAPSALSGVARLKEVRDYITQTIAAAFRKHTAGGTNLGARKVAAIAHESLIEALDVFQDYLS
ncbi:MAG: hypothetical protein CMQ43_14495 [Gammaproteobacteria bacterium]|nr:hypothetical protein [Gammaproteobacteria bacterium]